ncbi:MAG TPA: hypothetical protein VJK03_02230 [Candidatus Nanoarchaeia archaeon]|nr:hypothetical protein [Candidatus Nanoarchaeia archaeon]
MPKAKLREAEPRIKEVKEVKPRIKEVVKEAGAHEKEAQREGSLEEKAFNESEWATSGELPTATIAPAPPQEREQAQAPADPAAPQRQESREFSVYDIVRRQDATRSYDPMAAQRPATLLPEQASSQQARPAFENPDMRQFHAQPSDREYQERLTTEEARVKRKMPWEF